jgi:iron complex outermembrane receptor protein
MKSATKIGLLGATFLTAFGLAAPAAAQDPADGCPVGTTLADDGTCQEEDEAIVVTGSRLRNTAFTSASPVGVITAEEATLEGLANTAEIIQQTPSTGGAFQVNTQLTGFVTTGGPGAQTIGLRGLGPQRTLVLMNGRRIGPAGTRGTVGPVDLNVIPSSLIQRVEILKDGASSIYGSDAVAGVVNFITREDFDGIELNVYSNFNEFGGGEQHRISGSWGTTWTGGYFNLGAEYYQQEVLRNRDRDDLACASDYLFVADPNGHAGLPPVGDRIDYPNTDPGQEYHDDTYKCNNLFARVVRAGVVDLNPILAGNQSGNRDILYGDPGVVYPGAAQGNDVGALGGVFAGMHNQRRVGFEDTFPYAHMDSPLAGRNSAISPMELTTIAANFGLDLGGSVELYSELLFNRRESIQYGARQFAPSVNVANPGNHFGAAVSSVLPIIPFTADRDQQVNYMRGVLGLRGDFGDTGWNWDIYTQASHSDGDYGFAFIYNDRVVATTGAVACNQAAITISGGNCADLSTFIPWTSARILNGDFNAEERAFLFDHETGNTTYDQRLIEATVSGPVFDLPAGTVEVALGAAYRTEEIDDLPGLNESNANFWGSSAAGHTFGDDTVQEYFAEANIPILADQPLFESLDLSLSGRLVDYESYGEGDTYKVGLNWRVFPDFRIRASTGTSFRAPALYELYLANQTSFLGQTTIDPCTTWETDPNAQIQANCAAAGVPMGYTAAGSSSATIFAGGGAGILDAEQSEASTIGVIWTPTVLGLDGLSVAVDYFDFVVEDEIRRFGAANIVTACYQSANGPANGNTDPFCSLFDRNGDAFGGPDNSQGGNGANAVEFVDDNYLNVAHQGNRGIDVSLRYERDIGPGELTLTGEATFMLEDIVQIFAGGIVNDYLGTTQLFRGPEIVARGQVRYDWQDWTANWTTNYIGEGSDDAVWGGDVFPNTVYCTQTPCTAGTAPLTRYDQSVEPYILHDFSLRRRFENENGADISILIGLQNIFDERPPSQSTGQFRRGTAALNGYDLVGRRAFFNVAVAW